MPYISLLPYDKDAKPKTLGAVHQHGQGILKISRLYDMINLSNYGFSNILHWLALAGPHHIHEN